jgi:hypothetical protein
MSKEKFDWEEYVRSNPYERVVEGLPCIVTRLPTMFSPDRTLLYLRSQCLEVPTDDTEKLLTMFTIICSNFERKAKRQRFGTAFSDLYFLEVEYRTLWRLLSDLDALPEGHEVPETYLEELRNDSGGSCGEPRS